MSIKVLVYRKGTDGLKEEDSLEEFSFPLEMMIYDMKDDIMWKMYCGDRALQLEGKFYLEIENITGRVYKDFGKLFFDKGLLPKTIDNFPIKKMSSANREYIFMVYKVDREPIKHLILPKPSGTFDMLQNKVGFQEQKVQQEEVVEEEEEEEVELSYDEWKKEQKKQIDKYYASLSYDW